MALRSKKDQTVESTHKFVRRIATSLRLFTETGGDLVELLKEVQLQGKHRQALRSWRHLNGSNAQWRFCSQGG